MKRLVTIFLVSFIGFFAAGQSQLPVPMTVVGEMYVTGTLRSDGAVHVKNANQNKGGVIDNQGGLLYFGDGLYLYSNDSIDGLLRNQGGTVFTEKVVVRKTFTNVGDPDQGQGFYYTFSFPFRVGLSSDYYTNSSRTNNWESRIIKSDGSEAKLWDDYYVAFYDSHKRAFVTGRADGPNWTYLNEDSTIYGSDAAYLEKGEGYRIWSLSEKQLDFELRNPTAISELFDYKDKSKALIYEHDPNTRFADNTPSEGWNLLGGLNTTSFLLKQGNVGYLSSATEPNESEPNLIYYWDKTRSSYVHFNVEDPSKSAVLSPYVTFYVQTDTANTSFNYKTSGLVISRADPIGFRSAKAPTKDMLRLTIASETNPSFSDDVYVELKANYEKWFKAGEDGLKMFSDAGNAGNDSFPQIYSWFNKNFETTPAKESSTVLYELALNRLPSVDQEVKLGIVSPDDGRYTFSLKAIQHLSVKSVFLKDKKENQFVDLLQDSYTCRVAGGKDDDRFVLFIQTGALPIGEVVVEGQDIVAYANNNTLTIKNVQKGDQIKILDLSGRIVVSGIASSNEFFAKLIQKGVYLVNVKGEKNVTMKVMNK